MNFQEPINSLHFTGAIFAVVFIFMVYIPEMISRDFFIEGVFINWKQSAKERFESKPVNICFF